MPGTEGGAGSPAFTTYLLSGDTRITPVLQMRKENPRVAAELSRVACLARSRQWEGTWSWHLDHEKGTRFLKCRDKRGLPCVRL